MKKRASIDDLRQHAQDASKLLKALANETRLLILCFLHKKELSVSDINQQINISQSALSQHLALLRKDRMVTTRRVAQTIYYSLADGPAAQIVEALSSIYCSDTDINQNQ